MLSGQIVGHLKIKEALAMKKLLTCETTVLSLFFSLVLTVLTLSWQAHPQANPHEENFERQPHSVISVDFRRKLQRTMNMINDLIRRMAERCRKDPNASNCGPVVQYLEVPTYGFFLALEEDGVVFRSSRNEWNIPIGDCPEYIENFFERIITLMGEHNAHEMGRDAVEVYANGLIFKVTPGSEFFTFIENLPDEVSFLENRITLGCEEE